MLRKTKADIGKSPHQLFVLVCVSEIVAAVYQIIICYFTAHEHMLGEYCNITHGHVYQVVVTAYVYNSAGKLVETQTASTGVKAY